jgi:predicted secreted protein
MLLLKSILFYRQINSIKIVFKKKGLFILHYGPFALEYNNDFDGKCRNVNYNINTQLNKGLDNNIDLL